MFNRKISFALLFVATALVAVGCAKPPQAELDSAQAALTQAQTAEAQRWAADEWTAAQEAMDAAKAEVAAQGERFALVRSYDEAKRLATEAASKAEAAQQAAVAGKQQAKEAAQTALETAVATVDNGKALIAELQGCKRKPKGFAADMTALTGSLDGLSAQVSEVESAIASEDYDGAKARAEAINTEATTLVTDLESAKTKMGC